MSKLFTIIIPCYNAENFIDKSMESAVRQTIDTSLYEIIAVNDASTDHTLEKLNRWADRYPDLIKVITYEDNLRQGGARNVAMKQASGEYISFLDADDWIEADALEVYKSVLDSGKYDIVASLSEENYEIPEKLPERGSSNYKIKREYTEDEKADLIADNLGYVCTSIYRRKMITDNEVWFPEHLAYEDIYWQRLIKFYAINVAIMDCITYHHYIHGESTINKRNASHQTDRLTSYEKLLSEIRKRDFLRPFYCSVMRDMMETYFFNSYYLFFVNMDETPDVYTRIRDTIYEFFPDWENLYDDSGIPMVFQYMIKFLKKAKSASPADLQPFKDAVLEIIS